MGPVHSLAAVTIPLQKNSKQPDHTNSNKNNTKTTKLTKKTHQTKTKENTETKKKVSFKFGYNVTLTVK